MENKYGICKAIGQVAWGYIFILFHINIGSIDILPGWIGYMLFFEALPYLETAERTAGLLRPLTIGLGIWELVLWVTNIYEVSVDWYAVAMLANVIELYFNFQILTNIAMIADRYQMEQRDSLLRLRTIVTILMTIMALPIPMDGEWQMVVLGLGIVAIVVLIWICSLLFSLRKRLAYYFENVERGRE